MSPKGTKRTCSQEHTYYKSSDCLTCPVCESLRKPVDDFLSHLAAPARRAFERAGIISLDQLTNYSKEEILSMHGIGKSSIPKLEKLLGEKGLMFKQNAEN